jgi:type I restriction enzyme, R subunit
VVVRGGDDQRGFRGGALGEVGCLRVGVLDVACVEVVGWDGQGAFVVRAKRDRASVLVDFGDGPACAVIESERRVVAARDDAVADGVLAPSDQLDVILDACVATYLEQLDEDQQVEFKGKSKGFVRTYGFLAAILPYTDAGWEKLSIFLNFLIPKLPAPKEDDAAKGILETIDMDSYRSEKQAAMKIQVPDEIGELDPVPAGGGGLAPEPEFERLSDILKTFNEQFGNIEWTDADRIGRLITEEIPERVAADPAYINAQANSDKQNARIEHDKALGRVMGALLKDDTELFKQFTDNESFRKWLLDSVFAVTYQPSKADAA